MPTFGRGAARVCRSCRAQVAPRRLYIRLRDREQTIAIPAPAGLLCADTDDLHIVGSNRRGRAKAVVRRAQHPTPATPSGPQAAYRHLVVRHRVGATEPLSRSVITTAR